MSLPHEIRGQLPLRRDLGVIVVILIPVGRAQRCGAGAACVVGIVVIDESSSVTVVAAAVGPPPLFFPKWGGWGAATPQAETVWIGTAVPGQPPSVFPEAESFERLSLDIQKCFGCPVVVGT